MMFLPATLYAISASSLLAVLLGFLRGGLDHSSAALALGGGLLVAAFALWQQRDSAPRSRPPSPPEWLAIVAFLLVSLRVFLWVVYFEGDDIKVLLDNNLGDLPLHLTYVRYLANGVPFWPDNPIFTGGKLTYPIGVDLFHSLFVLLGCNVFRGFIWIGLLGSALTGAALWRWGRGFALFGFLANGGLAGLVVLEPSRLLDFQSHMGWKSIVLALFATQRGLLFALPAGLLLLASWRSRFFTQSDHAEKSASPADQASPPSFAIRHSPPVRPGPFVIPFWGEVLLYSSLPLFHFHTLLFLSAVLGVWFVFHAPARLGLLRLIGSALIPATILVLLITGGLEGGHLLGWKAGWMSDDQQYFEWCQMHLHITSPLLAAFTFWPVNFGVLPILVGVLLFAIFRPHSTPWARLVVLPSLGIFLLCCFVKFAPWEWDNTKLMIWSYLAILPFLWSEVLARWPDWARVPTVVLLFFSGFLSTFGGMGTASTGQVIASRSQLDSVAEILRQIPPSERFAGAPTYNHPLLLNGRKMVLGYEGHVSSHGLAWEEPAAKLKALMNGDAAWAALAADLGAHYLFWGPPEEEAYPDSTQPWRQSARLLASGDWGALYDLQSPADPAPPTAPATKE
jgi:hypothetical protein